MTKTFSFRHSVLYTFKMNFVFILAVAFACLSQKYEAAAVPPVANPPLRICAFNIQVFGQTKMDKPEVVTTLIEILLAYDLILIQEIRDSSNTAFVELTDQLNAKIQLSNGELGDIFESVISTKLGRSNSKEQYGFLYRRNLLTVTDTYQFPVDLDLFERPPFIVRFYSPSTEIEDFAVLALHTKPTMAPEEIGNVTLVYDIVSNLWDLQDILVAGDLNSDCSYLQDRDHDKVALFTDQRFNWLIGDDVDTTTTNSECSYDRFVAAGAKLIHAVVPDSPKVFKFDEYLDLTKEQRVLVSDHYPIEMELAGKANMDVQSKVQEAKSVEATSEVPTSSVNVIRELYKIEIKDVTDTKSYQVTILKEGYSQALIIATIDQISSLEAVEDEIGHFQSLFPEILTSEMEAMILALMNSKSFNTDYVYGIEKIFPTYQIEISCDVKTLLCTIRVEKIFQ